MILCLEPKCPILKKWTKGAEIQNLQTLLAALQIFPVLELKLKGGVWNTKTQNLCSEVFTIWEKEHEHK